MKFFISSFLVLSFYLPIKMHAQEKSLKVVYKQTKYFDPNEFMPDMPNDYTTQMVLSIQDSVSLYQKDPDQKEEIFTDESGFIRRMKTQRAKSMPIIFKNLDQNVMVSQQYFFDKYFLIEDTLQPIKWKIAVGEQKNIVGYNCIKAWFKDSTHNVVVYFTPTILNNQGPDQYFGLPGLILEVQSADFHAIATEIISEDEPKEILKPAKGTVMTAQAFQSMKEEKIKERKEMMMNNRRPHIMRG